MKLKTLALAAALALSLATPLTAEAQPKQRVSTIGFLGSTTPFPEWLRAFEQGLGELGWIKGQNINIEYRFGDGRFDRLPGLASELVSLGVNVILAASAPETSATKRATGSIPIVFAVHGDPVGSGDVESLARPGGNITGFSQVHPDLIPKQLDLLKQATPQVSRVGVIWNAANPAKAHDWREAQTAAKALGIALESREVRRPADLEAAFGAIQRRRPEALLILGDPLTFQARASIAEFAAKERLPAMYPFRQFVDAGGLMSYGANLSDLFRRAAGHVDKILKGARPADLPVEQPTKFELVINMKTAKALGLTIPPSLLLQATEVIQ